MFDRYPAAILAVTIVIIVLGVLAAGHVKEKNNRDLTLADAGTRAAFLLPSEEDILRGDPSGRIIVLEYFDLECPFCKDYDQYGEPRVIERYEGKPVAFAYRHLPLRYLHPNALIKAEALECAAQQRVEARKELMSLLYRLPVMSTSSLAKLTAAPLHLDEASLAACLASGEKRDAVAISAEKGAIHGISITPTFVVYKDGKERARIEGYRIKQIESTLDLLLSEE